MSVNNLLFPRIEIIYYKKNEENTSNTFEKYSLEEAMSYFTKEYGVHYNITKVTLSEKKGVRIFLDVPQDFSVLNLNSNRQMKRYIESNKELLYKFHTQQIARENRKKVSKAIDNFFFYFPVIFSLVSLIIQAIGIFFEYIKSDSDANEGETESNGTIYSAFFVISCAANICFILYLLSVFNIHDINNILGYSCIVFIGLLLSLISHRFLKRHVITHL